VPQPRKRDSLLKAIRENYETTAKKLNEYTSYPGDWIYASWSESDLKQFLDERGIPAPQPSSRDKLVASVRRNSRVAALSLKEAYGSVSASASAAQKTAADAILDAWSDSQIKEWADKQGIKVPQGSKRNELLAIARRNSHLLFESAASAFGAATSNAGNEYAKATDDATLATDDAFNKAVDTWSSSRLKAYLDSRGVPAPQGNKRDELLAAVRLNKHKAATGFSAWTFDTWTADNLKAWLQSQNHKAGKKAGQSREDLLKHAQDSYASASKAGGTKYASASSYLTQQTAAAKDTSLDTWSESEIKHYLDSYGISTYQGSTLNELRALARRNANYFRYGTTTPQGTLFAKIQGGVQWVLDQVKLGAASGRDQAGHQAQKAGDQAKEKATAASNRAQEAAQSAGDKVKEEL
jgi:Putative nuclear envelope organisation protein